MYELTKIFEYKETEVRVVLDQDNKPWWVARDVCDVLGITSDISSATERIPNKHKGTATIRTLGGNQEMLTISESGVYKLIFKSRKKEAEAFQDWVTDVVLPEIRKTGQFVAHPLIGKAPIQYTPIFTDQEFWRGVSLFMGVPAPIGSKRHPSCGKFLMEQIYGPMGVDKELQELSPKDENGHRKDKLHSWLTSEAGRPTLLTLQASFNTCVHLSQGDRFLLRRNWETYLAAQAGKPVQLMCFMPMVPESLPKPKKLNKPK